ncbi:MAG TPA: hypothetical protein VGB70_14655 [Allosphingosinicella sp.]|jgi:hypothetical protein
MRPHHPQPRQSPGRGSGSLPSRVVTNSNAHVASEVEWFVASQMERQPRLRRLVSDYEFKVRYAPVTVVPAVLRSSRERTFVLVARLRPAGKLSAA